VARHHCREVLFPAQAVKNWHDNFAVETGGSPDQIAALAQLSDGLLGAFDRRNGLIRLVHLFHESPIDFGGQRLPPGFVEFRLQVDEVANHIAFRRTPPGCDLRGTHHDFAASHGVSQRLYDVSMILENGPSDVQRNQADFGWLRAQGGRAGHSRHCQGLQRMSSREFQAASCTRILYQLLLAPSVFHVCVCQMASTWDTSKNKCWDDVAIGSSAGVISDANKRPWLRVRRDISNDCWAC